MSEIVAASYDTPNRNAGPENDSVSCKMLRCSELAKRHRQVMLRCAGSARQCSLRRQGARD